MAQVLLYLDFQEGENYLNCQTGLPHRRHMNATFSTLHHSDRRSSNLRLCMHVICDSNFTAWDMLISVHCVLATVLSDSHSVYFLLTFKVYFIFRDFLVMIVALICMFVNSSFFFLSSLKMPKKIK